MIVKMIQVLRNRMELWIEKIQEKFNKDLGELKTNRDEQDNNKMKNALKESIAEQLRQKNGQVTWKTE